MGRRIIIPHGVSRMITVILIGLAIIGGCDKRSKNKEQDRLPDFGTVPEFEFTGSTGFKIGLDSLRGYIWIADFIFTHCEGPCPLLSMEMSRLDQEFHAVHDLRLVSFTVDPERDTPDVLREYAGRYGAAKDRWFFLTGDRKDLHALAYHGFHIGDRDNPYFHSTYLILVDSDACIRGYYDGLDKEQLQRLRRELPLLLQEESE